MNLKLLVLRCITIILLLIPIAGATYDVVSGIASNSTEYTTSASYTELHNISLATGTGTVFIKASWDARMNFTAPLYGRFMRDGISLGRFNLTQSVYAQVGSYELALNETTGTHYYGWEVYSNKRGTLYSRNFSAVFLKNGTYVSSVIAQSPLTYTGITDVIIKDERTTYPNDTISGNLANWNATYNATYDAKEPAISQGVSPQFWMFNKTWQNITTTWLTEGTNQWFTNARAISAVQSILDMMNQSSATNNTNSQARDDIINSTKANKTDAGELSGGTLAYSIFPVNITIGTGGISFSNGTNNISVGSSKKMRQSTNGIITGLYVNQTSAVACSGNVTVTSSGVYKAHITWSSANNASSTGLSSSFTAGDWLLYNMTENTGCVDFTFVQVHTKTS